MCRKGFTLIELLVVIAIIAVLASILFPVFAGAREKARQVHCLSNLRNIAFATMQYIQDNDGRFPFWRTPCWVGGPQFMRDAPVPVKLDVYTRDRRVFQCPSTGRDWSWPLAGGRPEWWVCGIGYGTHPAIRRWDWVFLTHYGFNEFVQNDAENYGQLGLIQFPSEFVIWGDSEAAMFTPWGLGQPWGISPSGIVRRLAFAESFPPPEDGDPNADMAARHQGGSLLLFVDLHIKYFRWRLIRMRRLGGPLRFQICDEVTGRKCQDPNFWLR